jgi:hypothetical protein
MKHIVCTGLAAGLIVMAASASNAQTAEPKGVFVNVGGGAQTEERTINTSVEFPLYQQTASVVSSQNVGKGGIFDINAGYRVWKDLSVGVGLTTYSKTGEIVGAASIPHPLFLDRHQTTEFNADGKRTERSFYIQGVWFVPLSRYSPTLNKLDVALSFGPSFVSVEQDVFVGASVPAGTQDATPEIQRHKDSTVGVILAADVTYMVTRNVGAGGFIRYQGGGSIELPQTEEQGTGGFQIGGGLRLRF